MPIFLEIPSWSHHVSMKCLHVPKAYNYLKILSQNLTYSETKFISMCMAFNT